MTRIIKFRAWDEKQEIMHYDFQFITTGGSGWVVFESDKSPRKTDGPRIIFDNPYSKEQIKIMQYTGLKDKNGVEIYEGDIVKFEVENSDQWLGSTLGTIAYCEYELGFYIKSTNPLKITIGRGYDAYPGTLKVLGNIYQDPDLLK